MRRSRNRFTVFWLCCFNCLRVYAPPFNSEMGWWVFVQLTCGGDIRLMGVDRSLAAILDVFRTLWFRNRELVPELR